MCMAEIDFIFGGWFCVVNPGEVTENIEELGTLKEIVIQEGINTRSPIPISVPTPTNDHPLELAPFRNKKIQ